MTNLDTLREAGNKVIKEGCYADNVALEATSEAAVEMPLRLYTNECEGEQDIESRG